MTKQLEALIASEIADFFATVVEIHTEIGGPNTVEEAQQQLTERVTRIASECEAALIAALEQSQQQSEVYNMLREDYGLDKKGVGLADFVDWQDKRIAELEAKLETADKLQDSAFRHGLQHGFSYGQTNDQAGFEQAMKAYSNPCVAGGKVEGE